jgi:hypothetical protein
MRRLSKSRASRCGLPRLRSIARRELKRHRTNIGAAAAYLTSPLEQREWEHG